MTGTESDVLLAAAEKALAAGRWAEARDGFRAALDVQGSGAALFGLGLALWWLREPEASIRLQERAYRAFRRSGDHERAFFTAMFLCLGYDMTFGNASASRGWLAKLSRLVKEHGLAGLEGWELLCRAVVEHESDVAWGVAVGSDLALPEIPGKRSLAIRLGNAWSELVFEAAEQDAYVAEVFGSVTDLLAPPTVLLHPRVRLASDSASVTAFSDVFGSGSADPTRG